MRLLITFIQSIGNEVRKRAATYQKHKFRKALFVWFESGIRIKIKDGIAENEEARNACQLPITIRMVFHLWKFYDGRNDGYCVYFICK